MCAELDAANPLLDETGKGIGSEVLEALIKRSGVRGVTVLNWCIGAHGRSATTWAGHKSQRAGSSDPAVDCLDVSPPTL
jgi:hypothetical protein